MEDNKKLENLTEAAEGEEVETLAVAEDTEVPLDKNINLAIRSSLSEPQSAPCLVFADYIELLHLRLQRI